MRGGNVRQRGWDEEKAGFELLFSRHKGHAWCFGGKKRAVCNVLAGVKKCHVRVRRVNGREDLFEGFFPPSCAHVCHWWGTERCPLRARAADGTASLLGNDWHSLYCTAPTVRFSPSQPYQLHHSWIRDIWRMGEGVGWGRNRGWNGGGREKRDITLKYEGIIDRWGWVGVGKGDGQVGRKMLASLTSQSIRIICFYGEKSNPNQTDLYPSHDKPTWLLSQE